MIRLCTDSNSQLPTTLSERYRVEIVPITVRIDGVDYAEGIDLHADDFYARFAGGAQPDVTTSQPSPGAFASAYRRLADEGATEIVSIHVSGALSGTLNSARLAAVDSPVPVHLVDSGTASFGISCWVWEAGEALRRGADAAGAVGAAETLAPLIGNVFVVQAVDLARRGGRLGPLDLEEAPVPVLSLIEGRVDVVGTARSLDDAIPVMASYVRRGGDRLRVAVGFADAAGGELSRALEQAIEHAPEVLEVVSYRVGPSVGVHTGPGTAGAFFFPSSR